VHTSSSSVGLYGWQEVKGSADGDKALYLRGIRTVYARIIDEADDKWRTSPRSLASAEHRAHGVRDRDSGRRDVESVR
jgi:hypothetical protein